LLVDFPLKENFKILVHGSLALMIPHHIVNLGPKRQYGIMKRIDNTTVPPSVAPSEFSPPHASRDELGPTEFLFSSRMPPPINCTHVSIFHLV